jgi:hypothetical protein
MMRVISNSCNQIAKLRRHTMKYLPGRRQILPRHRRATSGNTAKGRADRRRAAKRTDGTLQE